jgi:hypothetical protein
MFGRIHLVKTTHNYRKFSVIGAGKKKEAVGEAKVAMVA